MLDCQELESWVGLRCLSKFWEPNLDSLQEEYVLLGSDPSLQVLEFRASDLL